MYSGYSHDNYKNAHCPEISGNPSFAGSHGFTKHSHKFGTWLHSLYHILVGKLPTSVVLFPS